MPGWMTRSRAGPGDVPTSLAVEYYRQGATAGLIVTEGTQPSGYHASEHILKYYKTTEV